MNCHSSVDMRQVRSLLFSYNIFILDLGTMKLRLIRSSSSIYIRHNSFSSVFQAIRTANLSHSSSFMPSGNVGALQFRLKVKKSVFRYQIFPLFMKEKGSLTPRTLVFAAQKESDESESGSSQSCIEDQMHMAPEYNDGSRDPDVEVASITLSEADLSQSAVQLGNQGNLLDKLKAVHLHILAMEQWNASRIKLCHRYI